MKKYLSWLLCVIMAAALLAGCGQGTAPQEPADTGNSASGMAEEPQQPQEEADVFEQPVELILYTSGSSGADTDKVMAQFNEMLKEKCNTTIKVHCIGWDDYENQYNLILTSGEKVDLLYVNPNMYNRYAKAGAFTDITDMFPEYMPETYSLFTNEELQQIKVDGKIFAVPSYEQNYGQNGIFYRKDLADKYDVSAVVSLDTLEAYMDAVAQNESEILPINGNPEQALFQLFKSYYGFENIANSTTSIVMVRSYDDIEDIFAYPFSDEYLEWAHKMKDWAGRGFWSSNALSATMDPWSSIQVGTSAITQANPDGARSMMRNMGEKMPEAECDYWSFANLTGYAFPNPVQENGFAIPKASQNAERALRVLEVVKTDSELFDLWMYGIEGYHFDLTADGELVRPAAGQEAGTVETHSMSGAQYGMRVRPLMRDDAGQWEGYDELMKTLKGMSVVNKFGPVALDYSNVQAELAAVTQVVQQYGAPINIGIVSDVDAAVEEYRSQLEAAGIEKLVEEVKTQMLAYYTENNIN